MPEFKPYTVVVYKKAPGHDHEVTTEIVSASSSLEAEQAILRSAAEEDPGSEHMIFGSSSWPF